jgi:hypothetical protein
MSSIDLLVDLPSKYSGRSFISSPQTQKNQVPMDLVITPPDGLEPPT